MCWTPVMESLHDSEVHSTAVILFNSGSRILPDMPMMVSGQQRWLQCTKWSYSRAIEKWMRIGCYVRRSAIFAPQLRTMVVSITISMTDIGLHRRGTRHCIFTWRDSERLSSNALCRRPQRSQTSCRNSICSGSTLGYASSEDGCNADSTA